jgi:DNA (cytosine-5)-methyltransferase 1
MEDRPKAASVMMGTGGMAVGIEAAGFHTLGFLEPNDTWGAPTRANLPDRIHTTHGEQWEEYVEEWTGKVELVYGNPPCQGLTGANRNASADHWKNQMFVDAVRIATRMRPQYIIMENIPRMLTLGSKIVEQAMRVADEEGYRMSWHKHEAGQFRVGQRRVRVMFIFERGQAKWWPSFPHHEAATASECIGDLLGCANEDGSFVEYPDDAGCDYQARLRGDCTGVMNHHWWEAPSEFETLEPGESWLSLPDEVLNEKQRIRRREGRVYNAAEVHRTHPDEVPGTVTGMPNKMHYSEHRLVSTREASRFMGFPDSWVWPWNWNYAQMAAGVCPPVTEWYGRAMMHSLAGTEMEPPVGQLF